MAIETRRLQMRMNLSQGAVRLAIRRAQVQGEERGAGEEAARDASPSTYRVAFKYW
jgi:hypothetical protein